MGTSTSTVVVTVVMNSTQPLSSLSGKGIDTALRAILRCSMKPSDADIRRAILMTENAIGDVIFDIPETVPGRQEVIELLKETRTHLKNNNTKEAAASFLGAVGKFDEIIMEGINQ